MELKQSLEGLLLQFIQRRNSLSRVKGKYTGFKEWLDEKKISGFSAGNVTNRKKELEWWIQACDDPDLEVQVDDETLVISDIEFETIPVVNIATYFIHLVDKYLRDKTFHGKIWFMYFIYAEQKDIADRSNLGRALLTTSDTNQAKMQFIHRSYQLQKTVDRYEKFLEGTFDVIEDKVLTFDLKYNDNSGADNKYLNIRTMFSTKADPYQVGSFSLFDGIRMHEGYFILKLYELPSTFESDFYFGYWPRLYTLKEDQKQLQWRDDSIAEFLSSQEINFFLRNGLKPIESINYDSKFNLESLPNDEYNKKLLGEEVSNQSRICLLVKQSKNITELSEEAKQGIAKAYEIFEEIKDFFQKNHDVIIDTKTRVELTNIFDWYPIDFEYDYPHLGYLKGQRELTRSSFVVIIDFDENEEDFITENFCSMIAVISANLFFSHKEGCLSKDLKYAPKGFHLMNGLPYKDFNDQYDDVRAHIKLFIYNTTQPHDKMKNSFDEIEKT